MFYYVRMEEMIPENHLLRLVESNVFLCPEGKKFAIGGYIN